MSDLTTALQGDLERLARIITTLRKGRDITLPWLLGARGFEYSETWSIGDWQGERSLLLSINSRRGETEHKGRPEPCDWSLDAMIDQSRHWDADTIQALEPYTPGADRSADAVMSLIDGSWHFTAGHELMLETVNGYARIATKSDDK